MPRASITACRRAAGPIRISRRASCCCSSAIAGSAVGKNFEIFFLRQFCSNRVRFFYNTQETQTQKMLDQNLEIRILWFLRILKFSKRCRAVPLRSIWSIMVAAKLDHSRVLVTKFHQNIGQRWRIEVPVRDTHTQTDRQTRLKIRALQVCNRSSNQLCLASDIIWRWLQFLFFNTAAWALLDDVSVVWISSLVPPMGTRCERDQHDQFDQLFWMSRLITFRMSRRLCEMYCGHARLSAAACLHYCTDPDVTCGSGRGCLLVVQYWTDLQSVHGLCCYGNITRTRNVSEYMLVLTRSMLSFVIVCMCVDWGFVGFTCQYELSRVCWWLACFNHRKCEYFSLKLIELHSCSTCVNICWPYQKYQLVR